MFFGGLVVLALTAALVVPYFVDWNHYRDAFEREAGRVLGRAVSVKGEARVRLLPFPSVTFTNVVVAGHDPSSPAMTVEEFSMDAELAPLLRGEVLIFDMRLVRPSARLTVAEDGSIDWAVRPHAPFDARQVTLEAVTITDGSVDIFHAASGRSHRLTEIDAALSARTLSGPWRITGRLKADEHPVALTVSTGSVDQDGAMRVRIEALPDEYPIRITSDGQARFDAGAAEYVGGFTFDSYGEETLRALREGEVAVPARETARNRVSGRFVLAHDRLSVPQFRFETGPVDAPYHAEGKADLRLGEAPRFSISADGAQLRVGGEAEDGSDKGSERTLQNRLAALNTVLSAIPRPTIPGVVSINLPAIVADDTTIRDVQLRAEPEDGGWAIRSLAATLPGRTRFESSGALETGENPSFKGRMVLAVRQPSGFAAWLAKDVDEAIRGLPRAGFSANVQLSGASQSFSNLELVLGDARFTGSAVRVAEENAQPSVVLDVEGQGINEQAFEAFSSLFVSDAGANRLSGHDVDLRFSATSVNALGFSAESVNSAVRLRGDVLEIDRLSVGGLAGAQIGATGQIRDMASRPTGKIDATVIAADLGPLVRALSARFPQNMVLKGFVARVEGSPGLLSESELNIVASAVDEGDETSAIAISAQGLSGGTEIAFSLSAKGPRENVADADFRTELSLRNDDVATLLALAGVPALPLGLAGHGVFELSAEGQLADTIATTISVGGEGTQGDFSGTFTLTDTGPVLSGKAELESDDIEPVMTVAGVTLPGFGLGLPVNLATQLSWEDETIAFRDLEGEIAGGSVSGSFEAVSRNGTPHFTGGLELTRFDLTPFAEMVLGTGVFSFDGETEWPNIPFSPQVAAPFSAALKIKAQTLWAGYFAGAGDATFELRMDADGLALSNLDAAFLGGRIKGLANLANNNGDGIFSAQLSLEDAALQSAFAQGSLEGKADIRASVTASGKTVSGMAAALTGSGSAGFENLVLAGLNPDALAPLLENADAQGTDIDAERTAFFAPPIVRDGRFDLGTLETAFSIAGGVARTPPIRVAGEAAQIALQASADLQAKQFGLEGSITYDAGAEEVVGAQPIVRFESSGPFGAVSTRLDTAPLAQFLTQRALEREQARVEHMQALLLEKQRLRREARHYAALAAERERIEQERQRLERERRLQEEKRAAEEARRREEERKAEEERRRAEAERRAAEKAASTTAQPAAPRPEANDSSIERAPLDPPQNNGGVANSPDAVSDFFKAKQLSPKRLLELLGPSD